ncbi:hypothetical protein TPA0910_01970 [Streptomyces hygroscopicus subsp. sporocinereus]|uniref:Uncharacterized protein n=1 Tax=Streptomyces hygroscopicus TaxID=1912 RepID=A0ABQ3TR01_STRHY|nr:hypothetical protein TPA0910_01970 [Streptomyces hygroscopicus]
MTGAEYGRWHPTRPARPDRGQLRQGLGGADGAIAEPPMIRSRAMGWALVAFLTVALAGTVAYRGAALVLHRRSLAEWGTEWTETAPRWTTPPGPRPPAVPCSPGVDRTGGGTRHEVPSPPEPAAPPLSGPRTLV